MPETNRASAEAARYEILRRLAPSLKHDMVVNLQTASMMAEVMAARLEKGIASQAEMQKSASSINRVAREAVAACLKVAQWIAPTEDESVVLDEGIEECVALLRSHLGFRGFTLVHQVEPAEFDVSRVALLNLVCASILALADAGTGCCDITVSAVASRASARVTVHCKPNGNQGEDINFGTDAQRKLDWGDVEALASAETVSLSRTAEQIDLDFPRMVAASPLRIAAN